MFRGAGVGEHLIDFPGLQGNFVALVLQADNKLFCRFHRGLIEIALDLELSASNAMSFVPVYLRQPSSAIRKSDSGNTLSLPPASASVELSQSPNLSNGRADSKGFDMGDFSNNLEFH